MATGLLHSIFADKFQLGFVERDPIPFINVHRGEDAALRAAAHEGVRTYVCSAQKRLTSKRPRLSLNASCLLDFGPQARSETLIRRCSLFV